MVGRRGRISMFDILVYLMLAAVCLSVVIPLLYVIAVSLTPYSELMKSGGFVLVPQRITFNAYKYLFDRRSIFRSVRVTAFVTVIGTALNTSLTVALAYAMSARRLVGRRLMAYFVVFTMIFHGGLIPTYLVVKSLRLLNTVWAMIIPSALSPFFVFVKKGFFERLPSEMFEASRIDGASELQTLLRIVLPLSVPILSAIGLFYSIDRWNTFYAAVYFVSDNSLQPMQVIVRSLLVHADSLDVGFREDAVPTTTLQMAAVVVATLPIVLVYPFVQKHLIRGTLVGAIKG